MDAINPKFILRNYILEEAIRAADDKDDYSRVNELLQMCYNPYDETKISQEFTVPQP